jgi:tetratricopeptide (TPR) repeat protein
MIPRLAQLSISLIFLVQLSATPCLRAQDEIPTIAKDEAAKHLIKKVEPITPPIAKVAKTGGPVTADIVIALDGSVESLKITSGAPLLLQAATAAIKQWKFDPFIENAYAIRVRTSVEVVFPGQMSQDEQASRQAFFPVDEKCRQLVDEHIYSDAEKTCSQAVDLSKKLPADAVLERSNAQSMLGHAFFLQGKTEEALPHFQEALSLAQTIRQPNDADLASNYANLGRAYFRFGDSEKGDQFFSKAVETFEAAILGFPEMKDNYTRRLKDTLLEYAEFKRAAGETDAADALEAKANRL